MRIASSASPSAARCMRMAMQEQGNRALKTGLQQKKKFYLRQAIEQYTLGLELQCSNATLVAQLYGNRAHVSLLLGNYRNALEDARAALKADPTFVKVCEGVAMGLFVGF